MAITKIYKGTNDVTSSFLKAYKGETEIYTSTPPIPTDCILFQSPSSFTLNVYDNTKHWNGTLYYSTDTTTWSVWDGTTTLSSSVNNKLYLRGKGNTVITGSDNSNYRWVLAGSNIECVGNIESLLDWEVVESGGHPSMTSYCYAHLFRGCAALVSPPALPATTLTSSCYYSMFRDCTALTSVPALPATTLANYCYNSMFRDCIALTSPPALPATTLTTGCYQYMFQGCTALTSPPALPATTLANRCYQSMFRDCIALTSPPALPATTLTTGCYNSMFYECTSLTSSPALPATTLADYCYNSMFEGCTSLTSAPALPATTLANSCYNSMFRDCASLKISSTQTGAYLYEWRIPTSGTATTASNWNSSMLSGTGGTYTGNPSINATYYVENPPVPEPNPTYLTFQSDSPFTLEVANSAKNWNGTLYYSTDTTTWNEWDGTTKLSSVNNKLYLRGKGNTEITGIYQDFRWVLTGSNIKCIGSIDSLLDYEYGTSFVTKMTSYCYAYLFYDCAALVSAPALPATTLAGGCYQSMFQGCTALTSAPALPATTLADFCYVYMFSGCTALTSAPALPATTLATACYYYMFYGCTSLTSAPDLPATTLANYCYSSMFRDCTALTSPPALPATTLADYCYSSMFSGCTALKISSTQTGAYQYEWRIPTSGTATAASNWNSSMLSGTGGTFKSNPDINTTYYVEHPPV